MVTTDNSTDLEITLYPELLVKENDKFSRLVSGS